MDRYTEAHIQRKTMFCCVFVFGMVIADENRGTWPSDIYALSGGQVNLTCPVQNESKSVFWRKNTTVLSFNGALQEKYVHRYKFLDSVYKILQIQDVMVEDFGKFECYTEDTTERFSMQLHMIDIDIHYADFKNSSLYCNATGWPQMLFFWEHRSEFKEHIRYLNASDNGTYSLDTSNNDLFYQTNGKYICIIKNKQLVTIGNSAEIDVKIQGKPACIRQPEAKEWIQGSIGLSVSLKVLVYSVPTFNNISWSQGENIVKPEYTRYQFFNNRKITKTNVYGSQIQLKVDSVVLTIESLTKADFQNYTAHIVNTLGECYCTVELRIADYIPNAVNDKSVPVNWLLLGGTSVGFVLILVISHVICFLKRREGRDVSLPTDHSDEIGTVHYHSITIPESPPAFRNATHISRNEEIIDNSSSDSDVLPNADTTLENTNNADGYENSYHSLSQNRGEIHCYSQCILPDEQIDSQERNKQMFSIPEYVNLQL